MFVVNACYHDGVSECLLLVDDNKPAGPATKVVEAEGAKCTGIVILLVMLLPFAVLIGLDVVKVVKPKKKRNKRRKRRPPMQPDREFSEAVF